MEEMTSSIAQNAENAKLTDAMATKAAKEAVEGATGLKINYYAMVDLKGFEALIDAMWEARRAGIDGPVRVPR